MKLTVFGKTFTVAGMVSSLGLSTASSIILYGNSSSKYTCGPGVYYAILALCVWGWFMFSRDALFLLPVILVEGKVPKTEPAYVMPTYFLYAWAFVCYFDTRPECRAHLQTEFPDLWDMLSVYVWYFVLLMSSTVLFTCCGFVVKEEPKERANPPLPVQVEGVPGVAGLPGVVGEGSPV